VLGVYVDRTGCRQGLRLVRAYQRCLLRRHGPSCYRRVDRRCVQPVFLGRCRAYDRYFRRTAIGYRCIERRLYPIGGRYDANVTCVKGRRRIDHGYTLFANGSVVVRRESELRAAWANPRFTAIELADDIVLRACRLGDPIRESSTPVLLDGKGHTLRQGCFEKRLLRQDGTGFVELANVTLTRGGSDGPGAAVTTRGEIMIVDSKVQRNLAEEPGGGVMSQRRATIIRSVITGNLANDDGGGVYARRGGIQVYDSVVSNNLVDGSGGALGSTGDILVVRSHVDGNTTDGDGGAIYADEDGDVTVIDSTVDGSTADGPGGAIFTLGGDVTVVNSTLNGNRADDRGGAISGEGDVTIINSTVARNAAVAHVGGGIWARGNLYVANSTVSNNYAEGQGGGMLAAGTLGLVNATVADNIAPVAANVGAGERLEAFGSIIGPAKTDPLGGETQPTDVSCRVPAATSFGYNVVADASCGLNDPRDVVGAPPQLAPLADNGGRGETRMPGPESAALDRIPFGQCRFAPFGEVLEGEQHLAGLVADWLSLVAKDQRGMARPQGGGCDVGAVEVGR
jgi:predicted outer membrane repeat protein